MKKIVLVVVCLLLALSVPSFGGLSGGWSVKGGVVQTASDCDQSQYYPLGTLCQDTDDGKLYKGTGAAVVEVGTGTEVIDDMKGNGDTTYTWSADKIYDQLALKQGLDTDLTSLAGGITGLVKGLGNGSGFSAAVAGTDYVAVDAELTALAGLTFADASIIQLTGASAAAVLTSGGNSYFLKSTSDNSALEFASPSDAVTALGLVIGTNTQAYHASLASIAGLTVGANGIIYTTAADTYAALAAPGNNYFLGWNSAGVFGAYQNIQLDDSAAQFGSATASKGTLKVLLSGSTDGKLLTLSSVHTDDKTLYIPDPTTGDSLLYGSAPLRFNSGAATARVKTISDAADTIAEVGQNNTFTGTNTFNGAVNIGDGGDLIKTVMQINTTDGTWSGQSVYFAQCAASLAFGTPVYVQSSGKPAAANAAAAATMPAIGVVVVASTDADTPCTVCTHGIVSADAYPTFTPGGTVYIDDSGAGVLTATVGDISGTDHVVQVMGIALNADEILIMPSLSTITLE